MRQEFLVSKAFEGKGVVSFCESLAIFVAQQWAVEERWWVEIEGLVQQQLLEGAVDQIGTSDYLGNLHCMVINHGRELVRGGVVFTPDEKVSEVDSGHGRLRAK